MKDRKQNPALLIATLGVYLGLVLAGAAPSVLANAALSKQFNVRDEIEFVDEFDNMPDEDYATFEPVRDLLSAAGTQGVSDRRVVFTFDTSGLWETAARGHSPSHVAKVLSTLSAGSLLYSRVLTAQDAYRPSHNSPVFPIRRVTPVTRLPRGSLDPHFVL